MASKYYFLFSLLALFLVISPVYSKVNFVGRYKMEKSKNYSEFLKELGIGYFKRVAANNSGSEYVVTKNKDNTYTLRTITTFADSAITFKDGKEFEEARSDGKKVKSVIKIKGNKWTHKQKGTPEVVITREFSDEGVEMKSTANGVTATRFYKRQ